MNNVLPFSGFSWVGDRNLGRATENQDHYTQFASIFIWTFLLICFGAANFNHQRQRLGCTNSSPESLDYLYMQALNKPVYNRSSATIFLICLSLYGHYQPVCFCFFIIPKSYKPVCSFFYIITTVLNALTIDYLTTSLCLLLL